MPSMPTVAQATTTLYDFLPEFVRDNDAAGGWQFLTWLDGIGQQQQLIDSLCRDSQEGLGWSTVMDVSKCPTYALPWLAQFVGVRFTGVQLNNDYQMRSAILGKGNFARGSLQAIVAAVNSAIGNGGSVNIIERVNAAGKPDAYALTVAYKDQNGSITYAELPGYVSTALSLGIGVDPTNANVATVFPNYSNFPVSTAPQVTAAVLAAIPAGLVATVIDAG